MKKIYVCSRLRGDIEENIEKAKKYCEYIVKGCGADSSSKFLAASLTHIYFTQFLDDSLDEERAFGTLAGLQLLSECDRASTNAVRAWYIRRFGKPRHGHGDHCRQRTNVSRR